MKYLWGIFRRDMRHATSNVIALIVSMGLVIVPALYAWFNIAASWDPYDNTKSLKVAVANVDSGYKSKLIPVRINVGETVLSALRANHQLDWQFVDSAKAVDGVKSGEYYAAIVIPKSFSADMMTLFSPTVRHATLKYYLNEKINPIAPHITDEGASTVANTIDKTFAKTMAQVGLDLAANMVQYSQSPQMTQYMTNLVSNIDGMASTISAAQAQVDAYSALLGSADSVIASTDKLLASTRKAGKQARKTLKQSGSSASTLTDACTDVTDSVNQALQQAVSSLDGIANKVGTAFDRLGKDADGAAKTLQDLSSQVSSGANVYGNYIAQLEKMRSAVEGLPDGDSKQALLNAIDKQIAALQAAQQDTQDLATALDAASKQVAADSGDIQQDRQQILDRITAAKQSITTVQDDYEKNVKPKLDDLSTSVQTLVAQTGTVISGLDDVTGDIGSMSGGIGANVTAVRKTLGSVSASLGKSAGKLSDLSAKLKQAEQTGDSSAIASLASDDTNTLATLLSAPVALDRVPIYPIANYGSAMAPFYTVLSIWVGAIILVAIVKVAVSDREKAHVLGLDRDSLPIRARNREMPGNAAKFGLRLHHEYFGRLGIFALLALLQGTIVCLGDMYFLGVQAEHALQFLAVGWLCAVVFSNIVYTLTVSFGDIGKALAVVLLVMQVAGSGGTFPIQTLPKFFQVCYPFLPFPHAIDAMHAAMAGSYGFEYWIDLGALALFLLPSLLLGLVLRRPVIRLNNWVLRRLESTHVM
ncbi:YhgE/Pip domain-containing protein [Bifidobacterium moukalabense]|nr:YhgE/Pip domain-containing protein [Bifidobacterium moukalabense]